MKINRIVYDYAAKCLTVEYSGVTTIFEGVLSGSVLHGADPWVRGKGRIPPSEEITGEYVIGTAGWWSHMAGSWLFPITPNPIIKRDDPAKIRKGIGIHADAPDGPTGSAGCIVFPPTVWPAFKQMLRAARASGQHIVSLLVI